jgi:hypothetical protein
MAEDTGSVDEQLRPRWEIYLTSRNARPLLAFLREHPQVAVPCPHAYPYDHHISDVVLEGQAYRVRRCVRCNERLTFTAIEPQLARPDEPGVSYFLQGPALSLWAERTAKSLSRKSVDWTCVKALLGRGLD